MMEKKVKADQLPSRAYDLYLQLYCERKGKKDQETRAEARKSWAALSLSSKTLFHKTIAKKKVLSYTHGLSKSKIYLKKKYPKNNDECGMEIEQQERGTFIDESYSMENGSQCREENNGETESNAMLEDSRVSQISVTERPAPELSPINHTNDTNLEETDMQEINIASPTLCDQTPHNRESNAMLEDSRVSQISEPERPAPELSPINHTNDTNLADTDMQEINIASPTLCDQTPHNGDDKLEDALETQSTVSSIQRSVPLIEPTPPTLSYGKDLYEILKRPEDIGWSELPKKYRNHYNLAVRTIKREYIKNYTKYLESLSRQQLYDHYIKTFH